MRTTCACCGKRFDVRDQEVLAMAAKIRAKRQLRDQRAATETNGNLRTRDGADVVSESIALRFVAEREGA